MTNDSTNGLALQLRDLVKTYDSPSGLFTALHQINLQVPAGEFVAVVGNSGSGKTTLLNVVAGIDRPSQFLKGSLPFKVSIAAVVIWIVAVILGAVLATLAPASRASRLTVREALTYL